MLLELPYISSSRPDPTALSNSGTVYAIPVVHGGSGDQVDDYPGPRLPGSLLTQILEAQRVLSQPTVDKGVGLAGWPGVEPDIVVAGSGVDLDGRVVRKERQPVAATARPNLVAALADVVNEIVTRVGPNGVRSPAPPYTTSSPCPPSTMWSPAPGCEALAAVPSRKILSLPSRASM